MRKLIHSLQTKLTVSFLLLIGVIAGGSFLYTFEASKVALRELMGEELASLAQLAALQIDGNEIAKLKAGDDHTPAFKAILARLAAVKGANSDIRFVYVMRKVGDEVRFVVDGQHADPPEEGTPPAKVDEVYADFTPALLEGFSGPSAEKEFYTDKWGTLLSGYAPIRSAAGDVVGLVGIDMASTRVLQKQQFIGNTIYWVLGAGILFAGVLIALFSSTIIRDIRKLNAIAERISTGEMTGRVEVSRTDEIGDLADSFSRMVASLNIMMMSNEGSPPPEEQARP